MKISPDEMRMLQALSTRLGEWPLLLKLVNGVLRGRVRTGQTLSDALISIYSVLDRRGLTAFDAKNPSTRNDAVEESINAGLKLLSKGDYKLYVKLTVFPANIDIPLETLQKLWRTTGELDELETEDLCRNFYGLSLLSMYDLATRSIRLHDVMRSYLLQNLGTEELTELHQRLLDAYECKRWAELPHNEPYMWDHLAEHLIGAGRIESLIATVKDLRYLATKTFVRGVQAADADLKAAERLTPDDSLLRLLKRNFANLSHLLNRAKTFNNIVTVLYSRLSSVRELANICQALQPELPRPFLVPSHPLPDRLSSRTLQRYTDGVNSCAVSSSGEWVVSASADGTLEVWEVQAKEVRKTLQGHTSSVNGCAVSPSGEWVVSASADGTLKVWDVQTGEAHKTLQGHTGSVNGCAVSPSGEWIVSASDDKTLKVWDVQTGEKRLILRSHTSWVRGCAVSPSEEWIVSASADGTLKVWDVQTERYTRLCEGIRVQ